MTCTVPETDLMQYADAELPAERAAVLDQHLQTCPACVARVAQAMQMKRSVASAGLRYEPSPAFRARVRRSIAPRRRSLWIPALAFAAMILLASAVGLRVLTARSLGAQLAAEVVDRHVSALASASPVEVVSTDRHTVKPWFQGKLPFTFNLPELSGSPYVLEGGRMTFLNQSPGAQLIYDLRKHHISVFIFQDRDVHSLAIPSQSSAFTVETWNHAGLRYFAVGDVSRDDLRELVDRLKTAAGLDTP